MKYVMGKASIFNGAGRLHVYDFSSLLSGADGVRASDGFRRRGDGGGVLFLIDFSSILNNRILIFQCPFYQRIDMR